MNESASDANHDHEVDRWMDSLVRGVRLYSYQLGRLFNRFCFHFDQAHALAYRFKDASKAQQNCAVLAFRDIESQVQAFDPARSDRLIPLIEFRELIQDVGFLRTQFESLREKCDAREAEPEFHEILWLCSRERAGLPEVLLQALDHGDESAFQLGVVVDQGIRPPHAASELYKATIAGETWPETPPQPIRSGGVPPDPAWQLTLATWLASNRCESTSVVVKGFTGKWLAGIQELDGRIRADLISAPSAIASRLTVTLDPPQAVWNSVPYSLSDNAAWFLKALKEVFDDPQRRGELVSGPQIAKRFGSSNFRADLAKKQLPEQLRELVETKDRTGYRLKDCVA